MLETVKGTTFLGIDYVAPVTMTKTGNPYLGNTVTKSSSVTGLFGFDYESNVNAQLVREGKAANFDAQGRSWGENMGKGIIRNPKNGEISLQLRMDNKPSELVYRIDGEIVEKTVLEPFLPKKSPNKSQGTDKEIKIGTYKLDRIKAIRMNGEEYIVV